MTEEQLAQLLEQAAESGATKALKAAADAADDETKDDPADDETKNDDGKDDEAKAAPAAKGSQGCPRPRHRAAQVCEHLHEYRPHG